MNMDDKQLRSLCGGNAAGTQCQPMRSDLEKKVSYLKTIKAVWLPRQD
jgi:hypothetical protein